ncbi:hypothetical protein [Serinicoccus kebangsaanensis]|uniref:hypothetical protein n=1 Tax=Serinicoccus kebangsaanensis TaxID=2602069 RepID=UPI00124DC955|nr:hypothetical protein [Serinicoccus kebangsaanensis]
MTIDTRHLAGPAVGSGLGMAAYLLLRPYGDAGGSTTAEAAAAFASVWWVVAHLCGVLALASFARLALRLADLVPGVAARISRWASLVGLVLVLPYYGAETFALHVLGRVAVAGDEATLGLVDPVRDQPAAMAVFAVGLLLLALGGLSFGLAWQRHTPSGPAWLGWPVGVLVALVLPQFFLPPVGRMTFGVLYALAALSLAVAAWLGRRRRDAGGSAAAAGSRAAAPVAG